MYIFYVLGALFLWLFYKNWVSAYKFWEKRGFPFVPGSFPFGSSSNLSLLKKFQGDAIHQMYKKSAPSPYFGMYIMRIPVLVLRDPEIIRLVLAKDFSHFRDRQGFEISKDDYLSHHLFNVEGDRWRALRVKMSPTFTSGKMKGMFHHFVDCTKVERFWEAHEMPPVEVVDYGNPHYLYLQTLEELLISQIGSTINVKDVTSRFTTDIICSCAFGLEVNSMKNSELELRKIGSKILTLGIDLYMMMLLFRTFPSLMNFISIRLVPISTEKYLIQLIKDTLEHRKKNGVKRHDFLDILIELKEKGKLIGEETGEIETDHIAQPIEVTTELIAAQCFVFFIAGFETSSSVQSYCLYELALNPDIQEKLYNEIETTVAKHGDVTFQAVQEMEYLDMVIHETMRKYPTLPFLTRRCTKPFSMPAGNRVEIGDRIIIPTWSLHHDPEFFPSPEKFDPERFSPKNKETIKPYSYLPFGEGPRICIGMRFGLLQTKVGLIAILRKFQVSPSEKTEIPLQFTGSTLITTTKGPIKLKITSRTV